MDDSVHLGLISTLCEVEGTWDAVVGVYVTWACRLGLRRKVGGGFETAGVFGFCSNVSYSLRGSSNRGVVATVMQCSSRVRAACFQKSRKKFSFNFIYFRANYLLLS